MIDVDQYQIERSQLIQAQNDLNMTSQSIFLSNLSPQEQQLAKMFNQMLHQEIQQHALRGYFPPTHSFLQSRAAIDASNSTLLPFLRTMPKGNLHTHLVSAASFDWLVFNASHRADAYFFVPAAPFGDHLIRQALLHAPPLRRSADRGARTMLAASSMATPAPFSLTFAPSAATLPPVAGGRWLAADLVRAAFSGGARAFDDLLLTSFTIYGKDWGTYAELWDHFDAIFGRIDVTYEPVFREFVLNVFRQNIAEGILHLESRIDTALSLRAPSDAAPQAPAHTYVVLRQIVQEAQQRYQPDFTFASICSTSRAQNASVITDAMVLCLKLMAAFPDLIAGYDLVGPEDEGHALDELVPNFLHVLALAKSLGLPFRFYFHAGESDLPSNQNLFDAWLLNATRVGHGFQLSRNPLLMTLYKRAALSLEVCPISNQVLRFVTDLQNHPALELIRNNIPFSIASDDPGIFGYSGASYDFWMAAVSWQLDLVALKQLSFNSMRFGYYASTQIMQSQLDIWQHHWSQWVTFWFNQLSLDF